MKEMVALGEEHRGWKWKPYSNYTFAAQDHVAPLLITELHLMAVRAPLVFVPTELGMLPCALQGLLPSCNLFVGATGEWGLDYIPRYYQYSPFSIQEKQDGGYALCIDSDCLVPSSGPDARQLFADNGDLAEQVQSIAAGLLEQEAGYRQAREIAALLHSHGLLIPWEISISGAEGKIDVQGLYKVEEAGLLNLDPTVLEQLNKNRGLYMAYAQVVAAQHLRKLVTAQEARMLPQSSSGSMNDTGLVSFEFL